MMQRRLARLLALALATSVMTLPTLGAQAHNGQHDDSQYQLVRTELDWKSARKRRAKWSPRGARTLTWRRSRHKPNKTSLAA